MSTPKHTKRTRPKLKNTKEYFVWCDESDQHGRYFSNFYGGVLVKSEDLEEVMDNLQKACRRLHLKDEIKWHKISGHYADKYMNLMSVFFDLVRQQKIRVRIMFTQNANVATNLMEMHRRNRFFILYYHFIKHAFGLAYSKNDANEVFLRLYFDLLPDTLEKRQMFKEYIKSLQTSRPFQLAGIKIRKQDIAEVDSKKHLLLQMIDVVLGAMCFKLNDKHKEIPPGEKRRAKRTIAKEKVYKHINKKIREIRKGFNVEVSTGISQKEDRWQEPYRHWKFVPSEIEIDETLFK